MPVSTSLPPLTLSLSSSAAAEASTAPSGKLVVEEEFEEAVRRGLPVLVFLESGEQDGEAARLAERVSDYRAGVYRRQFEAPAELRNQITSALEPLMPQFSRNPTNPDTVQEPLRAFASDDRDPRARLIIAPSVQDEIVDPVAFSDSSFFHDLLEAGHRSQFFSYEHGKRPRIDVQSLSIMEADARDSRSSRARITLTTRGVLTLDKIASNNEEHRLDHSMSYMFQLAVDELQTVFAEMLGFAANTIERIDPHERYPTWIYNVALGLLGHRRIVDQRTFGNSYSSFGFGEQDPIAAFDEPRTIHRAALRGDRSPEIQRIITLLRRRQGETGTRGF